MTHEPSKSEKKNKTKQSIIYKYRKRKRNKTIIPLAPFGYEMIKANWALRA